MVRCYLGRTAPHYLRCEWLFVTAGRSKKEIAKNMVSFWLRQMICRVYRLSGRPLPGPPPKARETPGIAPSLLFKNFAVAQVLKADTWRKHTTFTRHYLRDQSHRSLNTSSGTCGGGSGPGLTWPVRLDIPSLLGLMTDG